MLLRDCNEVHIDHWVNLEPCYLLYVDCTLRPGRGGGGSGPPSPLRANQPCTRCHPLALYAPVDVKLRTKLWVWVKDFLGNTSCTVFLACDFNNRARPKDHVSRVRAYPPGPLDVLFQEGRRSEGAPAGTSSGSDKVKPAPLTPEERQVKSCLEALGLLDSAQQVPNQLLFHPTHSMDAYHANYWVEAAERGYLYYHLCLCRGEQLADHDVCHHAHRVVRPWQPLGQVAVGRGLAGCPKRTPFLEPPPRPP